MQMSHISLTSDTLFLAHGETIVRFPLFIDFAKKMGLSWFVSNWTHVVFSFSLTEWKPCVINRESQCCCHGD